MQCSGPRLRALFALFLSVCLWSHLFYFSSHQKPVPVGNRPCTSSACPQEQVVLDQSDVTQTQQQSFSHRIPINLSSLPPTVHVWLRSKGLAAAQRLQSAQRWLRSVLRLSPRAGSNAAADPPETNATTDQTPPLQHTFTSTTDYLQALSRCAASLIHAGRGSTHSREACQQLPSTLPVTLLCLAVCTAALLWSLCVACLWGAAHRTLEQQRKQGYEAGHAAASADLGQAYAQFQAHCAEMMKKLGQLQEQRVLELKQAIQTHNQQSSDLRQQHNANVADFRSAALTEREVLLAQHSKQQARLMKAWLLVRQQQKLMCKHMQQRCELQIREQEQRERLLESQLSAMGEQHAVRCEEVACMEEQHEQVKCAFQELQLELACCNQDLLDACASVKTKEQQIAHNKVMQNELQHRLQTLDEGLHLSQCHVQSLEVELQGAKAQHEADLQHVAHLQEQLSAFPKYECRLDQAAKQTEALITQNAEHKAAQAKLTARWADRDAKIDGLVRSAEEAKATHAQREQELQQSITEMRRAVEVKDREVQLRQADNTMLQQENKELRVEAEARETRQPHSLHPLDAHKLRA